MRFVKKLFEKEEKAETPAEIGPQISEEELSLRKSASKAAGTAFYLTNSMHRVADDAGLVALLKGAGSQEKVVLALQRSVYEAALPTSLTEVEIKRGVPRRQHDLEHYKNEIRVLAERIRDDEAFANSIFKDLALLADEEVLESFIENELPKYYAGDEYITGYFKSLKERMLKQQARRMAQPAGYEDLFFDKISRDERKRLFF